jgi:hypothetical protein
LHIVRPNRDTLYSLAVSGTFAFLRGTVNWEGNLEVSRLGRGLK